ncbi:hypothetical protein ACXIUS_27535 [Bosea thiooxidans]|nr:hypothetical protein [Bosea sp. (in: a-proteobacteria)]
MPIGFDESVRLDIYFNYIYVCSFILIGAPFRCKTASGYRPSGRGGSPAAMLSRMTLLDASIIAGLRERESRPGLCGLVERSLCPVAGKLQIGDAFPRHGGRFRRSRILREPATLGSSTISTTLYQGFHGKIRPLQPRTVGTCLEAEGVTQGMCNSPVTGRADHAVASVLILGCSG